MLLIVLRHWENDFFQMSIPYSLIFFWNTLTAVANTINIKKNRTIIYAFRVTAWNGGIYLIIIKYVFRECFGILAIKFGTVSNTVNCKKLLYISPFFANIIQCKFWRYIFVWIRTWLQGMSLYVIKKYGVKTTSADIFSRADI